MKAALRRHRILCLLAIIALIAALFSHKVHGSDREAERREMLHDIQSMMRETASYVGKSTIDKPVLNALGEVPRHRFVPSHIQRFAYENRPLPIGYGQTISQPYIVALMTDLLEPKPEHIVLEVGTGSGYQAAILAELVKAVYTIEIVPELGESANALIQELNIENIHTRVGDGFYGWEEASPFDSIIVTAAGNQVPPPLLKQLKIGGKMILPIGDVYSVQYLVLIQKEGEDEFRSRQILPVQFVPLTGNH